MSATSHALLARARRVASQISTPNSPHISPTSTAFTLSSRRIDCPLDSEEKMVRCLRSSMTATSHALRARRVASRISTPNSPRISPTCNAFTLSSRQIDCPLDCEQNRRTAAPQKHQTSPPPSADRREGGESTRGEGGATSPSTSPLWEVGSYGGIRALTLDFNPS